MDGVTELFQHDVQRGILRELDHEHARLHSDVPGIRGTCRREAAGGVKDSTQHFPPALPEPLPEGIQTQSLPVVGLLNLTCFCASPSGLMPVFFQ